MTLKQRYGIVLAVLLAYYAHFFVPLFTLTQAPPTKGMGLPGLEFLQGFALYDFHYLSIGIMPFVFASLSIQVLRWQIPTLFAKISGDDGQAELAQRVLTYLLGGLMALSLLSMIPEERVKWHESLVFLELLLTIASIEQLVKWIKPLQVITSPVMLFLGLNVLSSLVYQTVVLPYGEFDIVLWSEFALAVFLGVFTLVLVYFSFTWSSKVVLCRAQDFSGKLAIKPIPFKVLRAGVSPVIYVSFLMFPLLQWGFQSSPQHALMQNPWLIVIFFVCVSYFSLSLNALSVQLKDLLLHASEQGFELYQPNGDTISLKHRLNQLLKQHAWISGVWFTGLIVLQGTWSLSSSDALSGLGFVGGISLVLLVGVGQDVLKNYHSIRKLGYVR